MTTSKLLPFILCCKGCGQLCSHCKDGCLQFASDIAVCCHQCKLSVNNHCPSCSSLWDSWCGNLCTFQFKCSNPLIVLDSVPMGFTDIQDNYSFLGQEQVYCFGNVGVFQHNHTGTMMALQKVDTIDKKSAIALAHKWVPRLKQQHQHVIQLQQLLQRQIDAFYSKEYRTYLFYDYVFNTVQEEFIERQNKQLEFNLTEIYSYLLAVLSGLMYLQSQGINPSQVNLSQIYLTPDGIFKLLDPTFFDDHTPFQLEFQLHQQQQSIIHRVLHRRQVYKHYYLAPEQLQDLHVGTDNSTSNSCLFTIAIQVIQMTLMTSMDDCYTHTNIHTINQELISMRRDQAAQHLPQELMQFLIQLLETDTDARISLQAAYNTLLSIDAVRTIISELPIQFRDGYVNLLSEDKGFIVKSTFIQQTHSQPIQSINLQPIPTKPQQNYFKQLLQQNNYQIGSKKNDNAFNKFLNEKNYQIGVRPQRSAINTLEMTTQQDPLMQMYLHYADQPLVIYKQVNQTSPMVQQVDNTSHQYIREAYPNGCVYEGYKLNNNRDGFGKYSHPNGSYYEGEWQLNKMHGQGKFYNEDQLIYNGQWENDEFHGYGQEFNGSADNPQIDYHYLNNIDDKWVSYDGHFRNDVKEGKGMMQFLNGDTFEGGFKDGLPNGQGRYTSGSSIIEGIWVAGIWTK